MKSRLPSAPRAFDSRSGGGDIFVCPPVQVIQDEPGAVHCEEKGRLAADPSTRACDYRHTPIEEGARGLASREVLRHDRDPLPVRHGRRPPSTLARKEEKGKAMHRDFSGRKT